MREGNTMMEEVRAGGVPFSNETEEAVLSACLTMPVEKIGEVLEAGGGDLFYHPANRRLFEVLAEMQAMDRPVELVAVHHELEARGELEKVAGVNGHRLAELCAYQMVPATFGYYLGILLDLQARRAVMAMCDQLRAEAAQELARPLEEFISDAQQKVLGLRAGKEKGGPEQCAGAIDQATTDIEHLMQHKGQVLGLATGVVDLDRITNGLEPQDLVIIAARPSVGKTSLVMNMAEHLAVDQGLPGVVFSLEMSRAKLMKRMIFARSGVDLAKLKTGFLKREEITLVSQAASQIRKAPLWIDDQPGLTLFELQARARRLHKQRGIRWLAVDYLTLLRCPCKQANESREREVAMIAMGLKALLKELNIPGVVLAQLNRNKTDRPNAKPGLADLRESGQIEQEADKVILLHRDARGWEALLETVPEVERRNMPPLRMDEEVVLADVAKNRDGATNDVPLRFRKTVTRFTSLNPDKKLFASSHNKEERRARAEEERVLSGDPGDWE